MKIHGIVSLIVLTHLCMQGSFRVADVSLPPYRDSFQHLPPSYRQFDQVVSQIANIISDDCLQRLQMLKAKNPENVTYQSWSVDDYMNTLRSYHPEGQLILSNSVHQAIAVRLCNFKTYNQVYGDIFVTWNNVADKLKITQSSQDAVNQQIQYFQSLLYR